MILSDNTSGIKAIINNNTKKVKHYKVPTYLNEEELMAVKSFLWSHPKYKPTPLVQLSQLARELNISEIFIKDESNRFELDSFKIIGAITAIGKFICEKLGKQISQITFEELRLETQHKRSGAPFVFTTATDGNHGKAVAWASKKFGQHAVIYLPKGTAQTRIDAIKETGAEAFETDLNYDDTVEFCSKNALKNEWIVIQDTAWEGYTEIPKWIMQGYAIMGEEVFEQLHSKKPTHVFLQAGVGSMAGAVSGYFFDKYKDNKPNIVVIEPTSAACIFESVLKKDGKPHRTDGNLNTIMAGLSCGLPNPLAWEILKNVCDAYITCSDNIAANGVRILANPITGDPEITAGESGAVGTGLLHVLMKHAGCEVIRKELQLNQDSVVLLINTEGNTDPITRRKILWEGKYQNDYK